MTKSASQSEDATTRGRPDALKQPSLPSGKKLGRFVVLEELGRGGMGLVLRAYDPKLQREVALKLVRTDVMTRDAHARLVREARAMAKLSHPNVVAVYDVDLDAQQVVLVMEYVAGETLWTWMRREERSWADLVRAFVDAGQGLAAAHARGLLHRDFKPSNVLVGADGRARVTDFGLARPEAGRDSPQAVDAATAAEGLGLPDLDGAALTRPGKVAGTLRYMAPEQHCGEALTAAADQYSFCVALWAALTGANPFPGDSVAAKSAGPPPWPKEVAVPRRIPEALRRGLSPHAADRWPSMRALLAELEPKRRGGRQRLVLGAAAFVAAGAVAAATWAQWRLAGRCTGAPDEIASVWGDDARARVATSLQQTGRPYAEAAFLGVQRGLDGYAAAWAAMHTEACEATTIRGEHSAEILDLRMACLNRAKMEVAAVVELLAKADDEIMRKSAAVVDGLTPLSLCSDIDALRSEGLRAPPRVAADVDALRARVAEARSLRIAGKFKAASRLIHAAADDAQSLGYAPLFAPVNLELGLARAADGQYSAAEDALTTALREGLSSGQFGDATAAAIELVVVVGAVLERHGEGLAYAQTARGMLQRAGAQRGAEADLRGAIASVLEAKGDYAEAEAEHRSVIALRTAVLGSESPKVADSRDKLAIVLFRQGRYDEAEVEFDAALRLRVEALGERHPRVADSLNNLANVQQARGDSLRAEARLRAALELRLQSLGDHHPLVAQTRSNLGNVLVDLGSFDAAEDQLLQAVALQEAELGPKHPQTAKSRVNLGIALRRMGRLSEAESVFREALQGALDTLGADHPDVSAARSGLGTTLFELGRFDEAEHELRTALRLNEAALTPEHPHVINARARLGAVLLKQGATAEAEEQLRAGLEAHPQRASATDPDVAQLKHALGEVLAAEGRSDAAIELLDQAWQVFHDEPERSMRRAQTAFALARALQQAGRAPARAVRLARMARATYADAEVGDRNALAEVDAWLQRRD